MKKFLSIVLTLCLIVTCFVGCKNDSDNDNSKSTSIDSSIELKVPKESLDKVKQNSFENFTAIDLSGKKQTSEIFKGKKLTMINIWATFCSPCINEMPDLQKLSEEYSNKGFQIVGIISDITNVNGVYNKILIGDAIDIIEDTGVSYINLLPSDSIDMIKLSEVYSVPETIFVDENGKIVGQSYVGSRSLENWKAIVDELLSEM